MHRCDRTAFLAGVAPLSPRHVLSQFLDACGQGVTVRTVLEGLACGAHTTLFNASQHQVRPARRWTRWHGGVSCDGGCGAIPGRSGVTGLVPRRSASHWGKGRLWCGCMDLIHDAGHWGGHEVRLCDVV